MFNKENVETEDKLKRIKVSEESAKEQLNLFFEYYDKYDDIEDFLEAQHGEDRAVYEGTINVVLRGIKRGKLSIEIDPSGSLKMMQITKEGAGLYYAEYEGRFKHKMKGTSEYLRMHQLLEGLLNIPIDRIKNLKKGDLDLAEALGTLFLL